MFVKRVEQFLVVAVLAGQLCCQGWYFPGISTFPAYLLCLVALGVLSICVLLYETKGMLALKESFGPLSFLLLLNIALVLLLSGNFTLDRFVLIACSFTFCLACTQAFRTKEEVNCLLKWYLLIVLVSALVEIGQVFDIPFCTELWEKLHVRSDKVTQAIESERYLGLASDSLQFSYHVTAALAVVLFIKFKRFGLLKKCVLFAVLAYALFTNATRSGLMALLVIVIIRVFTLQGPKEGKLKIAKTVAVFAVSALLIVLMAQPELLLSETRFSNIEGGANARMPMLLTAFNHALRYPFGMGVYNSAAIRSDLIVGADYMTHALVAGNSAHNLLGNCVASYGFIGLGLMLGLYIWAYNTYRKKKRIAEDPTVYTIAFCALLGLAINAFFHNAYILNGELSSFVFFAIMFTKCSDVKATAANRIGESN